MFIVVCICFIIMVLLFVYLFMKIKLLEDDIESLYDNYASMLEKSFKSDSRDKLEVLKNA